MVCGSELEVCAHPARAASKNGRALVRRTRRVPQRAARDPDLDRGVHQLRPRAELLRGLERALVRDDQLGIDRNVLELTPPLTVARWPITFQSESRCTPGASRAAKARTRRSASSIAVTPIQRAVIAPVQ